MSDQVTYSIRSITSIQNRRETVNTPAHIAITGISATGQKVTLHIPPDEFHANAGHLLRGMVEDALHVPGGVLEEARRKISDAESEANAAFHSIAVAVRRNFKAVSTTPLDDFHAPDSPAEDEDPSTTATASGSVAVGFGSGAIGGSTTQVYTAIDEEE